MSVLFVQVERVEDLTGRVDDYFTQPKQKQKPSTNADRIRAMSDEELADMFDKEISGGVICPPKHTHKYCAAGNCEKCWLDWLKEEAEE